MKLTKKGVQQILLFACLLFVATSCNQEGQQPRRKDPLIVGQWEVTEIRSANGATEKAPGLTLYTFNPNNSYSFQLDKSDSVVYRYDGYFKMKDQDKTLVTEYTIEGKAVAEDASILELTKTDLVIKDLSNAGDTIVMKRRKTD